MFSAPKEASFGKTSTVYFSGLENTFAGKVKGGGRLLDNLLV